MPNDKTFYNWVKDERQAAGYRCFREHFHIDGNTQGPRVVIHRKNGAHEYNVTLFSAVPDRQNIFWLKLPAFISYGNTDEAYEYADKDPLYWMEFQVPSHIRPFPLNVIRQWALGRIEIELMTDLERLAWEASR